MSVIDDAIKSLTLGLSFRLEDGGYLIAWIDQDLHFKSDADLEIIRAVAVGSIHSLTCHNTMAILQEKTSFKFSVNGNLFELPVVKVNRGEKYLPYFSPIQIRKP